MSEMEAEAEVPRDAPVASVQIEGRGPLSPDTLTLWSEANCFVIPDGAILTLVHTLPTFDGNGEMVGLTKKPLVHFWMSHAVLAGSAALLIAQAISGAAQYGSSGAQEAVEEMLMKAIGDGRDRAKSIMQQIAEKEEDDNDQ